MKFGLQTHFNAPIGTDTLGQVRARGFTLARIDCQTASLDDMRQMLEETRACGMQTLPVVDLQRLEYVPAGEWAEFGNEPDGDIEPKEYRRELEAACRLADVQGIKLWAPAISNLDEDSLQWLNDVRDAGATPGWPAGLYGLSVHRYGDGTFDHPHRGFSSRGREVYWLKLAMRAGMPFLVSEFGYPTIDDLTDADQAARIRQEWAFWQQQGAEAAVLFQINDGPVDHREHRYGIRRCHPDGTLGDWKPSAYTVPHSSPAAEETMMQASFVLSRRDLIPVPGRAGLFTVRYPTGSQDTVLSVQPNGDLDTRPLGTTGPWEVLRDEGTRAVFPETKGAVYALPLVD